MRTQVLDKILAMAPTGYNVSKELPYDESGTEIYLKNPKTIYVGPATIDNDTFASTLDGGVWGNQFTSVTIYFTTDAKNIPANYETLVTDLRALKDTIVFPGAHLREAFLSTRFEGDVLVNELEYRLAKLN